MVACLGGGKKKRFTRSWKKKKNFEGKGRPDRGKERLNPAWIARRHNGTRGQRRRVLEKVGLKAIEWRRKEKDETPARGGQETLGSSRLMVLGHGGGRSYHLKKKAE